MSDNRNDGQWASWLIYAIDIYWSLVVLHYGGVAAHLSVMIESENESLASFLVNCPCERCDTLESGSQGMSLEELPLRGGLEVSR